MERLLAPTPITVPCCTITEMRITLSVAREKAGHTRSLEVSASILNCNIVMGNRENTVRKDTHLFTSQSTTHRDIPNRGVDISSLLIKTLPSCEQSMF